MENTDIYKIIEEEVGTKFKVYREQWKKSGKGEIRLDYPLHLNFELVSGCNFNCEFCLHALPSFRNNNKIGKNKILFDKYCEIINEGVKKGLCSIELNGINEPLLQKDIYRYIDYSIDSGVLMVSLHSNGELLTGKMAQSLIDSKLTLIIFSVDAFTDTTYKKIRKNDAYKKVINNINRFINIRGSKALFILIV